MAEGLDVEFRLGNAEDLPVPDASFDVVLSVFGAMFLLAIAGAWSVNHLTWRFISAEEFVAFFRRWYGPTLKAFEAAGDDGRMRWPPTWPTWPAAGTATTTAGVSPSRPATSRPS